MSLTAEAEITDERTLPAMAHRLKGGGVGMSNDILNDFVLTRMFIDCLESSIVPSLSVLCFPSARLFKSTISRPHSPLFPEQNSPFLRQIIDCSKPNKYF